MKRYISDTQCLLWYLADDRRLPRAARTIFTQAEAGQAQILVPSITLVEATYLLQRQRVNQEIMDRLLSLTENHNSSIYVIPLDLRVAKAVGDFGPAVVTDLPDRVIAATARVLDLPLLTTDASIADSGLVKVIA
ncbi:MAG: PIN domain-containing protein [Caldilineales bacterium]|nr:PIN domain-containing protein [Caldilineales bacterium]